MPFGPPGSLADIGTNILMAALQRQRQNPLVPSAPNAPVRPGPPPPADSGAYVPGGQGPVNWSWGAGAPQQPAGQGNMAGSAPTGLLGMLMQRMGRGMANAGANPLGGMMGGGTPPMNSGF